MSDQVAEVLEPTVSEPASTDVDEAPKPPTSRYLAIVGLWFSCLMLAFGVALGVFVGITGYGTDSGLDFGAGVSTDTSTTAGAKIAGMEATRLADVAAPAPRALGEVEDPGPGHFDLDVAMGIIRDLAELGVREAGSTTETAGFDLLDGKLRALGYTVARQTVAIPGGSTQNLIVERPGRTNQVLILGAHVDSKPPSPGANDNGSGCGVLMSLAEEFKDVETDATLRFIFFGAEEIVGGDPDAHHFGSTHYVDALSTTEKAAIAGMISVDMIGYGPSYHVRTMQVGPQSLMTALRKHADDFDYPLTYLKDPGWSDHQAFEEAGLPAAWLEWREDPVYHTENDVYSHVDSRRVRTTGEMLAGFLLMMDEDDLGALR